MPYKSAKQRRFMHAQHPGIARRWDEEYGGKVQKRYGAGSGVARRVDDDGTVSKGRKKKDRVAANRAGRAAAVAAVTPTPAAGPNRAARRAGAAPGRHPAVEEAFSNLRPMKPEGHVYETPKGKARGAEVPKQRGLSRRGKVGLALAATGASGAVAHHHLSKGVLRQSVAPRLARRAPLVGTGARRVITGDKVNARRIIGKADTSLVLKRRFDPEDRRRHWLGVGTGVAGTAGLGALGNAGRLAARDTQQLRNAIPQGADVSRLAPVPPGKLRRLNGEDDVKFAERMMHQEKGHEARVAAHQKLKGQLATLKDLKGKKGVLVGGRSAMYGGAGLALLGGAGAMHRARNEERWD